MSELMLRNDARAHARFVWDAAKFAGRLVGYGVLGAGGVACALRGWHDAQLPDGVLLARVAEIAQATGHAIPTIAEARRPHLVMLSVGTVMGFWAGALILNWWREFIASPARAAFIKGVIGFTFVAWIACLSWSVSFGGAEQSDEPLPPAPLTAQPNADG